MNTAMLVAAVPCSYYSRRSLLPGSFVDLEQYLLNVESFDKGCPRPRSIGQKGYGRSLFPAHTAPQRAVPAVMHCSGRVLRDCFCCPAEPPRPFEEHVIALVLSNVVCRHAHAAAHGVEAVLEFGAGKEGQAAVGPFLSDVALSLERGGPVDRAATAPGLPSDDVCRTVVGYTVVRRTVSRREGGRTYML